MEQPRNVRACRFCDCERWGLAELDPGYQIICMNCFARGPEKLAKDEAYEAWNAPAGAGRASQESGGKQLCSTDWLDALPAVGGRRIDCSIATYERRALMALKAEQEKIAPDNTLIAVLCDAVRLGREYCDAVQGPQSASNHRI